MLSLLCRMSMNCWCPPLPPPSGCKHQVTDAEVQKYKEDFKDADFDPKLHLRLDRPNPPSEDEKYVETWTFNIYYIRNDKLGINKFLRDQLKMEFYN